MYFIVASIYNLLLIVGTVYLIEWKGWSPWWFLMTMMFAASFSSKEKE